MKIKLFLIIALFATNIASTFAHAVWIESKSNGVKGNPQEVKIFFGEYTTGDIRPTQKWFSNLKDFKLELIAPDGSKSTLSTSADSLFYKTSFTPTQDGTYILSIVHNVAAIYQNAKLQYYAFANVAVGDHVKPNKFFPADASLILSPSKSVVKLNEPVSHQLIFKQSPLAKERITIVNPDKKKVEVETDQNAQFDFNPALKGGYFLEAFAEDKTPGKFDGKDFEKVWHVVTNYIEIK